MQNEKNDFTEKLRKFADSKGFYIILALCAIAIGVSADDVLYVKAESFFYFIFSFFRKF